MIHLTHIIILPKNPILNAKIFFAGNKDFLKDENQTVGEGNGYCAIRWRDVMDIGVVPISSIRKSQRRIHLYEWCIIESDSQRREGQIIFKGQLNIFL